VISPMPPNSIPLKPKLLGNRTVGPRGGALKFDPGAIRMTAYLAASPYRALQDGIYRKGVLRQIRY
jgi:hypothetical protein